MGLSKGLQSFTNFYKVVNRFVFMVMSKRAMSAIIGYVLLISITLALSVMVYNWLKFYVQPDEIEACPDNVNIIINGYDCNNSMIGDPGRNGSLSVTLKNKGLFTVDGYILKIHKEEDRDFGIYVFNETGSEITPGSSVTTVYDFGDYVGPDKIFYSRTEFYTVTLVEVQPFMNDDNGTMACKSYTTQKINCKD